MSSLIPVEKEWITLKEMAPMLVGTHFLPESIKTPQQAVAIMLKGRELNIPPMQALSQINVIKGKPTISAELMLALIYRQCPTAEIEWTNMTDTEVACRVRRYKSSAWQAFKWDMKDAQNAGLASGFSWKKYPRAMLRSRCISEMARAVFPDAIMGCSYTPEELGAEVTDEGEVIKLETMPEPPPSASNPEPIYDATPEDIPPPPEEMPTSAPTGYQGTKEQQDAIKQFAVSMGLDEEYYDALHEAMLGKTKDKLSPEIQKLLARQKEERVL